MLNVNLSHVSINIEHSFFIGYFEIYRSSSVFQIVLKNAKYEIGRIIRKTVAHVDMYTGR